MTLITNTAAVTKQRLAFKQFNRFMIGLWRLGLGRWVNAWPAVGGRILVIRHQGRKTGLLRLTPVNYAVVNNEVYCTAGFGAVSDWHRNIQVHPEVELWLPDGRWIARAEDVSDHPQRLPILRQVLIASGAVAPMMGLHPKTMTDSELAQVTPEYRLIRFHMARPSTGPGGPGELAWIWWPVGFLTVVLSVWLFGHKPHRPATKDS